MSSVSSKNERPRKFFQTGMASRVFPFLTSQSQPGSSSTPLPRKSIVRTLRGNFLSLLSADESVPNSIDSPTKNATLSETVPTDGRLLELFVSLIFLCSKIVDHFQLRNHVLAKRQPQNRYQVSVFPHSSSREICRSSCLHVV